MSGHSAAEIHKSVQVYMTVFATLMVLTVLTVGLSYVDLPTGPAIAAGLAVATVKASLVALYFMHLIDEEKVIYWLLALAAAFFVVLMFVPTAWYQNSVITDSVYSVVPAEGSAAHAGDHGHGDDDGHGHGDDDHGSH